MTIGLEFSSLFSVELIKKLADDDDPIDLAKVSTLNDRQVSEMSNWSKQKFIEFLMENRHGSPFEHSVFRWRIEAPIFVWREFMRHRIASYNEQSGRYTVMKPKFYIPDSNRNLVQIGKPGAYTFVPGTQEQFKFLFESMVETAHFVYGQYQKRLNIGIAKEVARMDLGLNIYSAAYVTMNARALMNFLSLRVESKDSTYKSFPMFEIGVVATSMEQGFKFNMPITHAAFVKFGRVQP